MSQDGSRVHVGKGHVGKEKTTGPIDRSVVENGKPKQSHLNYGQRDEVLET